MRSDTGLNGNPIPKTLPPELAPPSSRDLNDSVGFLKNLLKHDTNARATTNDGYNPQGSYAKQRSLHENAPQPNRKDATVYRHNDAEEATTYKSSSRHIDRDAVRYAGNDSPTSDLDDVKKSLQNTRSLVEKSRDREEEEEELKDNLRDLKRRIERVHDDLEYNLRSGRRTAAKDDEKRKLERELLNLEHEELPALSKKMEDKAKEVKRDRAKFALERDQRNNNYDRFDDRRDRGDSRDDYDSRSDRRGYNRGTYDEDDSRNRRDNRRNDSPPRSSRTPPPPPPPVPIIKAPPPPPAAKSAPLAPPAPSPSPSLSSMTAEERTAHIRAAATQRLADRARALGLVAPSASLADTSIADRLEQDRQEAAARVAEADKVLAAKEVERQAKLEKERLRSVAVEKSIQESASKSTPAPASAPAKKVAIDPEEAAIAEQEATMLKEKAARQARLKQLEKELEEAKEAEDNFIKNKAKFAASAKATARAPPPPPSRSKAPPAAPAAKVVATPPVVEAPPPVVPSPVEALQSPVIAKTGSTNPFHRLGGNPAAASPAAVAPPSNPFFRIGAAAAAGIAAIPVVGGLIASDPAPAQPAVAKLRPPPASDDDWDVPKEKEGDDSSSDEDEEGGIGNRNARQGLASALFGGIIAAPARPISAQASTPPSRSTDSPAPAAAPRTNFPPPPTNDEPVVRPMALLGQIAGGFSLKKTQTKDRSTPSSAGAVIGDASAPVQHSQLTPSPPRVVTPPTPVSVAPVENGNREKNNRESVDWHGVMAADGAPSPVAPTLPAQVEEEEEPEEVAAPVVAEEDPLDAVDLTISEWLFSHGYPFTDCCITVQCSRSLYAYEGQRGEDLSFAEGVVILAHLAKDPSSPWWYGAIASSGAKGWFPASYIESIDQGSSPSLLVLCIR